MTMAVDALTVEVVRNATGATAENMPALQPQSLRSPHRRGVRDSSLASTSLKGRRRTALEFEP